MASPFSIFRKNQKVMLALLTLLAMFGFVFIPIIMQMGEGRASSKNPVAVKTKLFGDLQESDLARLRASRQKVRAVLIQLGEIALQKAGQNPAIAERFVDQMVGPSTEDAVVTAWLKARHAQKLGMVIGGETVNQFLKAWTGNSVKPEEMEMVFRRASLSATEFFELMQEELLALKFGDMFEWSLRATTPAQRWDYFNRVKCMATIEAIPVAVADYVKDVKAPTEEELKKFFEENKETLPSPISPEPGFRVPHKVAFEYFKADVDQFADKVTDAEIQKRYEKKKEFYDEIFKKPAENKPFKLGIPADTKAKETNGARSSGGSEGVKPKDAKAKDAGEAKAPVDVKKDAKEPAKTEPKEPAKTESKEPAKNSTGSMSPDRSSPFVLTAYADDAKGTPETKATDSPAKADAAAKVETAKAKDEKAVAAPAAPAKKADEPKGKAADESEEMSKEMKNRIRRDIARERILKIFIELQKPMDAYEKAHRAYVLRVIQLKGKEAAGPAPKALDFEKLAKDTGLTTGRTGLVSQWDARELDVAMSLPAETVGGELRPTRGTNVLMWAYQSPATLRPTKSIGANAHYLFWKSEDAKEDEPKFEDKGVREEVLRMWNMVKARDIAKKAAEALAADATKAEKSLKVAFANKKEVQVLEPPKFSWMTMGNVAYSLSERAEMSEVLGVPMAGDEFMRTVFRLKPGKVGVAFNAPKTVVYVVQPNKFSPLYETRWVEFGKDARPESFRKYEAVGLQDQQRTVIAWLNELKTSAGFSWAEGRKPDRIQENGRRSSGSSRGDDE